MDASEIIARAIRPDLWPTDDAPLWERASAMTVEASGERYAAQQLGRKVMVALANDGWVLTKRSLTEQ